ncbi:MAG TPA: hypothetical protein VG371_14465 [Solirubrobacteraceae bacterium]|nr:hypothetical protein [Solirubrobacteraceae bacterium]
MSDLLAHLRADAVTLVESELPSSEEVRVVVGSLIKVVDQVVEHLGVELQAPALQTAVHPSVSHAAQPTIPGSPAAPAGVAAEPPPAAPAPSLVDEQAALAAAQTKIAELEQAAESRAAAQALAEAQAKIAELEAQASESPASGSLPAPASDSSPAAP